MTDGITLKERTYCDAGYTRIVERDESPKGGKVLLGNEGDEVPREVAEAVGLVEPKRSKTERKEGGGDEATEDKDGSKTKPEITHIGGGVYETPSGKRVKGRNKARAEAEKEAAEADGKSDED